MRRREEIDGVITKPLRHYNSELLLSSTFYDIVIVIIANGFDSKIINFFYNTCLYCKINVLLNFVFMFDPISLELFIGAS